MDGITGIKCAHKIVDLTFAVYCCYLPPEDFPWGHDSNAFFGHLLAQTFLNSHLEHVFVCGDVNTKLGTLVDYIEGIDNIPPIILIDNAKKTATEMPLWFPTRIKNVRGKQLHHTTVWYFYVYIHEGALRRWLYRCNTYIYEELCWIPCDPE